MSRRRRARRPAPTTDTRPPEARLEAMVREESLDRAQRILARIRKDLDASTDPAPWLSAARNLSDRLVINEDSWYYLAELFTECLVYRGSENDPELLRLLSEMEGIQRAHGLGEDDYWHIHEAPAEWQALNHAWNARADEIVNASLREFGHADVADLREKNRAEYDARTTKGRIALWGPDDEIDDYDLD